MAWLFSNAPWRVGKQMPHSIEQFRTFALAYQLPDEFARLQLLVERHICHVDERDYLAIPVALDHAQRSLTALVDALRGVPGSPGDPKGVEFCNTLDAFRAELVAFLGGTVHQEGRREIQHSDPECHYKLCQQLLQQSPLHGATCERLRGQFVRFLDTLPAPLNHVARLGNLLAPIVHWNWECTRSIDPVEGDAYDFAEKIQAGMDAVKEQLEPYCGFLANVSFQVTCRLRQILPWQAVRLHDFLTSTFGQLALIDETGEVAPVPLVGAASELPGSSPETPRWSKETGELFLGTTVIRTVRGEHIASTIVAILDGFERAGWPPVIDNPFGVKFTARRTDALRSLNRGLNRIQFRGTGEKGRIRWQLK
ncbi:MAG: hypothetical protein U0840_11070 [Gemmataceae bacterium]